MHKDDPMPWIGAVNRFWFDELDPDDWFSGREEVDAIIRARFGELRAALQGNPPRPDVLDAAGFVAAIIVFDQFSRNLFRNSPGAYATDEIALALACVAVAEGLDQSLGLRQRQFLYMPFMHSEDLSMQARSVALFTGLGLPKVAAYARHHRNIIDRFGRFPHRNAILGRPSTDAEREFLKTEAEQP